MPNHAPTVGNLGNVACSIAPVKPSMMPHLIVKHDDASCFAQIVLNLALPLRPFNFGRWARAVQMGAGNNLCATVFDLGDIR